MAVRSFAICFVAALGLAGCDGGEPSRSAHPLVGAWRSEGDYQRSLVTSARAQTVVDPSRPGSGDLRYDGNASGTVRHVTASTDQAGRSSFTVFSMTPHAHPFPTAYAFLSLSADATGLTVWRDGAHTQYTLPHHGGPAPHTFEEGRLTVRDVTLTSPGGATVQVGGSLAVATRTILAGTEQEVARRSYGNDPGESRERVFEPGGAYRETRTAPGASSTVTGTWEVVDEGRVRLSVEGGQLTAVFDYDVQDGTLALSERWDPCANTPLRECLAVYEREFGLGAGSLTRVRQENGEVLTTGASRR